MTFEDRVFEKLDQIAEAQSDIKVTLAQQQVILDEHIRRTELLEKELDPVTKHVSRVEGALKLLGVLSAVGGLMRLFKVI